MFDMVLKKPRNNWQSYKWPEKRELLFVLVGNIQISINARFLILNTSSVSSTCIEN